MTFRPSDVLRLGEVRLKETATTLRLIAERDEYECQARNWKAISFQWKRRHAMAMQIVWTQAVVIAAGCVWLVWWWLA